MKMMEKDLNLVLIANNPQRASMLRDTMERTGIRGIIRRLSPGVPAIDCARRSGAYRDKDAPDLILFDYVNPDEESTSILRNLAFSKQRARVPVVLLTSASSRELLNTTEIADSDAIMFSPTSLTSFIGKMKVEKRSKFFKALDTLFQYGPILVRMPESLLRRDFEQMALSA
ncbi:MAG: hypothetical protein GY949_10565 [Gammaproteobacteria bacterium]|nr:hypothetical protein [Gammaproteobacteria bacterium]